jgi:hypothetical protein
MTVFKQVAQDTDVTANTEIVLRQYRAGCDARPAPGRVPTTASLWERSSMLLRWQIGGQFDLKAANDEKIQTNGANGVSRGRMRNHHRRLCRNRTRASGRFYSPGERHRSSCARRGAAAEHAINAAISNLQSIESKYCASIERNTRLPGNAGYKSRRALSGAPGRPVLARRRHPQATGTCGRALLVDLVG